MPLVWFNGFGGSCAENLSKQHRSQDMVGLLFLSGTPLMQVTTIGTPFWIHPWVVQRWVGGSSEPRG